MHFHLPRPLHGWREFAGEVGIIVIGVLIALSAEQLVEAITSHREVRETRQALDAELAHDLGGFEYRRSQQDCIDKRLAELTIVLERQRHGAITRLKHDVIGPLGISMHFAVWEAASGEARAHMPLQAKLKYAALYDLFRNFRDFDDRERANWERIEDLDFEEHLTPDQLQLGRASIRRLQRDDALLPSLEFFVRVSAEPLHVHGDPNVIAPARAYARQRLAMLCAPLI